MRRSRLRRALAACVLALSLLAAAAPAAGEGKAAAPAPGSPERTAILDALRRHMKGVSGLDMVFVVRHLAVKDGWAWIETNPQSRDGKNRYEPVDALLHREEDGWAVSEVRPCCAECEEDPDCSDLQRWYRKLLREIPGLPAEIFPLVGP